MWSLLSLTLISFSQSLPQSQFQTRFQDFNVFSQPGSPLGQLVGQLGGQSPQAAGQGGRGGAGEGPGRERGGEVRQTTTPVPILKQINEHNEDGSYTYGYEAADGTFKLETRFTDGAVQGKYGYVDENGEVKIIEYGANAMGFQPQGDLPEGIVIPPPVVGNCTDCDYDYDYVEKPELSAEPAEESIGLRVLNRARAGQPDGSVNLAALSQNRGLDLDQPITKPPLPRRIQPAAAFPSFPQPDPAGPQSFPAAASRFASSFSAVPANDALFQSSVQPQLSFSGSQQSFPAPRQPVQSFPSAQQSSPSFPAVPQQSFSSFPESTRSFPGAPEPSRSPVNPALRLIPRPSTPSAQRDSSVSSGSSISSGSSSSSTSGAFSNFPARENPARSRTRSGAAVSTPLQARPIAPAAPSAPTAPAAPQRELNTADRQRISVSTQSRNPTRNLNAVSRQSLGRQLEAQSSAPRNSAPLESFAPRNPALLESLAPRNPTPLESFAPRNPASLESSAPRNPAPLSAIRPAFEDSSSQSAQRFSSFQPVQQRSPLPPRPHRPALTFQDPAPSAAPVDPSDSPSLQDLPPSALEILDFNQLVQEFQGTRSHQTRFSTDNFPVRL